MKLQTRQKVWKQFTKDEFLAFIRILTAARVSKQRKLKLDITTHYSLVIFVYKNFFAGNVKTQSG